MKLLKLLNYSESKTHTKLQEVCKKYGATVYVKVRIADVLPINGSNIKKELFRFALQAHFDFVVVNEEFEPQFAVEFDGPSHKTPAQVERDRKKNELCEVYEFPLLRINAKYLDSKYRNFDLLSWFIEVWFWRKFIFEAQENGSLPLDEIFDPMLMVEIPERKERFPLWLSTEILMKFRELWQNGKIRNIAPNGEWIGVDDLGNYYGIIWIRVDDESGVIAKSAISSKSFPVVESDILSEILVFQLYEELSNVLDGNKPAIPIEEIERLIIAFKKKYQIRRSMISNMPTENQVSGKT